MVVEGQQVLMTHHQHLLPLDKEVVLEQALQLKQEMVSVGHNNILEVLVHIILHLLASTIWEVEVLVTEVVVMVIIVVQAILDNLEEVPLSAEAR